MADLPDVKETIFYRRCIDLYKEYQALMTHTFNSELDTLNHKILDYLKIDVYQVENDMVVTFILDVGDLKNGGN